MMVMTAKVDFKKTLVIITAVAAVILALILIFGGGNAAETSAPSVSGNEGRVEFLRGFGWEVSTAPKESSQVRIPEEMSDVYRRYNALQQSQGYDLSAFAGKSVMRYVYQINNYPGATEPVFATLLVSKGKVIGGDITDTAPGGRIHGFKPPQETTAPTGETAPPTAETAAASPTGAEQ